MTALIMKRNEKPLYQRYGEKANELISLDVYEHSFRINDSDIMALQK